MLWNIDFVSGFLVAVYSYSADEIGFADERASPRSKPHEQTTYHHDLPHILRGSLASGEIDEATLRHHLDYCRVRLLDAPSQTVSNHER